PRDEVDRPRDRIKCAFRRTRGYREGTRHGNSWHATHFLPRGTRERLAGSVGSRQRPSDDVVPFGGPESVVPAGRHDDELATIGTQLESNRSAVHARRGLELTDALTRRSVVDPQNGIVRASVEHESPRCR